jgi:TolB-like protein
MCHLINPGETEMQQKSKIVLILILFLMFSNPLCSAAKDKYVVAVLPFTSHSAENIDYVRYGVWDMLFSRISYQDRIQVVDKDAVSNLVRENKDLSSAEILDIGTKLKADYVVWGSLTKIGSALSVDGKLFDMKAVNKPALSMFSQCQNFDEVIPKINEFAQKIDYQIMGTVPETLAATTSSNSTSSASSSNTAGGTRDSQIIRSLRSSPQGTLTAAINTEFINTPEPLDRQGFWMSQKLPTKFKGMDIGDVNNDGKNEVIIIDDYNVYVYQKKNKDFILLKKIAGRPYEKYLSVDIMDINENGIPEIIITRLVNDYLRSFVLEYKKEQYGVIADKLGYFLRAVELPDGTPLLMGQSMGMADPFMTPIYEMVWKDNTYKTGKRLLIPEGLAVYSVSFVNFRDSGSDKILVIDDLDRISIYEKTDKPLSKVNAFGGSPEYLYRSDDVFGGTNNMFDLSDRQKSDAITKKFFYVNLRTFSFDTNKDDKKELIIVKNLSPSGRYFSNVRNFTAAEIYDLEWDGMGFIENWRTKKINGYVCDYQFKDIDNDGQKEVVLALVLSVSGALQKTSVIVAYDLIAQ